MRRLCFTVTVIALFIILCGCGKQAARNATIPSYPSVVQTEKETAEPSREYGAYSNLTIALSNADIALFEQYINNITTEYPFQEFYSIDRTLGLNAIPPATIPEHQLEVFPSGTPINANVLFDLVQKNNKNAKAGKTYGSSFYEIVPSDMLKVYCEYIAEAYTQYEHRYPNEDFTEARCILENLNILYHNSFGSYAWITDDDCLLISKIGLSMGEMIEYSKGGIDEKLVILHEVTHLFQKSCTHNEEDRVGISRKWVEIPVNPYYWRFYYESSAELSAASLMGKEPILYEYPISYAQSIVLSSILNDSVKLDLQEKVNIHKDDDLFYHQFILESGDKKIEIASMMLAIDLVQFPDSHAAFFDAINVSMDDEEAMNVIKRQLKPAAIETLNKYFYLNLARAVSDNKNVTLDDVLYIISLWEADIYTHLLYDEDARFDENSVFMRNYVNLQNLFWNCLYSHDGTDVVEAFNAYQPDSDIRRLHWLPEDKKDFVFQKSGKLNMNIEHIRDSYGRMKGTQHDR